MTIRITHNQEILARKFFEIGVFQRKKNSPDGKGFRLVYHEENPDLPLSPFYFNFRTKDNPKTGPLDQETLAIVGKELALLILDAGITADYISGVPNAGDPIAKALCQTIKDSSSYPPFLVKPNYIQLIKHEKEGKREGVSVNNESIEIIESGGLVLLVDDLITKAHSKMKAIEKLEEVGLEVFDILVIIDRMQGGAEDLMKAGHRVSSIYTVHDLIYFYYREGLLSNKEYDEISRYLEIF